MDDQGKMTGWTALLLLAGIGLALTGGALAPDYSVYTWLLVGAWGVTLTAFNNVYRKVHDKVTERAIREDENAGTASGRRAFEQYYRNAGQEPPAWDAQDGAIRASWTAIARASGTPARSGDTT